MSAYWVVENRTRGTVIGSRIRLARSLSDRMVGLLRTPEPQAGEGLWIENSPSIHMFFMRYAIDAAFVDKGMRVTKIASNLKPWRIVWWARGARDCLELPAGTAGNAMDIGDQLRLVETPDAG